MKEFTLIEKRIIIGNLKSGIPLMTIYYSSTPKDYMLEDVLELVKANNYQLTDRDSEDILSYYVAKEEYGYDKIANILNISNTKVIKYMQSREIPDQTILYLNFDITRSKSKKYIKTEKKLRLDYSKELQLNEACKLLQINLSRFTEYCNEHKFKLKQKVFANGSIGKVVNRKKFYNFLETISHKFNASLLPPNSLGIDPEWLCKKRVEDKENFVQKLIRKYDYETYIGLADFIKTVELDYTKFKKYCIDHKLKMITQKLQNSNILLVKKSDMLEFLQQHQHKFDATKLKENLLGEEPEWLQKKRKKDATNPPKLYIFWEDEEIEHAIKLREEGFHYKEIAEKLNRSTLSVKSMFRNNECKRPKAYKEYEDYLRENYNHKTKKELAEDLMLTPNQVHDYIKRLGIKKVDKTSDDLADI